MAGITGQLSVVFFLLFLVKHHLTAVWVWMIVFVCIQGHCRSLPLYRLMRGSMNVCTKQRRNCILVSRQCRCPRYVLIIIILVIKLLSNFCGIYGVLMTDKSSQEQHCWYTWSDTNILNKNTQKWMQHRKSMYWVCIVISFAEIKQQRQQQQPFYGHYTGQLVLAGTSTGGFCWCSFTARMPLLTATSTFRLGRRRWSSLQECYLHCRCTMGIKD